MCVHIHIRKIITNEIFPIYFKPLSFIPFLKVSRRLLPLQLEWSLRTLVECCPLLTAIDPISSQDHGRDRATAAAATVAPTPQMTQSEALESAGAALAAVATWARAQPHLHITHVPIGIDKLDLRSCETSSNSASSQSSSSSSGIGDEDGSAAIGARGSNDDDDDDDGINIDYSGPTSRNMPSPSSTQSGAPMRALVACAALKPEETRAASSETSAENDGDGNDDEDDEDAADTDTATHVNLSRVLAVTTTGPESSLELTMVRQLLHSFITSVVLLISWHILHIGMFFFSFFTISMMLRAEKKNESILPLFQ